MRVRALIAAGLAAAAPLLAQEAEPKRYERKIEHPRPPGREAVSPDQKGTADIEESSPGPPKTGGVAGPVAVRVPSRPRRAAAAAAAALPSLEALSTSEGEARLRVNGIETVVKPGNLIGGDVVKSVSPGRLVLSRVASPGEKRGDALLIVSFDARGRPRTRVVWTRDPFARVPPEVRQP